jgi:hypothetical protein
MDQTEILTTTATAPKQALFVLGVHRSGTSALAGGLHLLGVNLGDNLQTGGPPSSITPGAFINQDIVLVHDILFRDLGCRWDMVGSLPDGWIDTEAADRAAGKLTRILERQLLGKRSLGSGRSAALPIDAVVVQGSGTLADRAPVGAFGAPSPRGRPFPECAG